ncbi:hypothetical protein [Actinomadura chokoriensis]|uniref:Uncharacterized protein n=1 Tax=Actinomadura chokoriensis TaxID=454156 RepID=A0ABV4R9E6_9ACTN
MDQLLALVEAIREPADRVGLPLDETVAVLLDPQQWRHAYQAEAKRRADSTRATVQAEQGRAALAQLHPGQRLEKLTDPFALGVHRTIKLNRRHEQVLPALPRYVRRDHDVQLAAVVRQAADGASVMATLVGESSTGKTRALWESLGLLRERADQWRVWPPLHPMPPCAALAELPRLAPQTVVWLDDAHLYLTPAELGEQFATGLRTLLRDQARAPILVLGTLWPEHWVTLTARQQTFPDTHSQARQLLDGHDIPVPDAFDSKALDTLTGQRGSDPRLAEAAERACEGQITQYLAGVPALLARYRYAPPEAKAIIHTAMDARRLGAGPHLPRALLAEAAPAYLTDRQWEALGNDWMEKALAYTSKDANGIGGILAPVRPRPLAPARGPHTNNDLTAITDPPKADVGPLYRLADYLEQSGRQERRDQLPPAEFWEAAGRHATTELQELAHAAASRGLYFNAAKLHKLAAAQGDTDAAAFLVDKIVYWGAGGVSAAAHWAVKHADPADTSGIASLIGQLNHAEMGNALAELLALEPARHAVVIDPWAVAQLLEALHQIGEFTAKELLALRAAKGIPLDDPSALSKLLEELRKQGLQQAVQTLLQRAPAAHAVVKAPSLVSHLLAELRSLDKAQSAELAHRAARQTSVEDPVTTQWLIDRLLRNGHHQDAVALAERSAENIVARDKPGLGELLQSLYQADARQTALRISERAVRQIALTSPAVVSDVIAGLFVCKLNSALAILWERHPEVTVTLTDADEVESLLDLMHRAGGTHGAKALAIRVAQEIPLGRPYQTTKLLEVLHEIGATQALAVLAKRAVNTPVKYPEDFKKLKATLHRGGVNHALVALEGWVPDLDAALSRPSTAADVLEWVAESGDHDLVTALADQAADRIMLEEPGGIILLLETLAKLGEQRALTALAQRTANSFVLLGEPQQDPVELAELIKSLRHVREDQAADQLARRAYDAGLFEEVLGIPFYVPHEFCYGRDSHGAAAAPWGWTDL